jgi:DNA gyrase inhibitor GyrI
MHGAIEPAGTRADGYFHPTRLTSFCASFHRDNGTHGEVTSVTVAPQTAPGIRKRGNYRQIAELLTQIAQYAMEEGIPLTGPPVSVLHEGTAEEAIAADNEWRADIGLAFPVPPGSKPGPGMSVYLIPGGEMANDHPQGAVRGMQSRQ